MSTSSFTRNSSPDGIRPPQQLLNKRDIIWGYRSNTAPNVVNVLPAMLYRPTVPKTRQSSPIPRPTRQQTPHPRSYVVGRTRVIKVGDLLPARGKKRRKTRQRRNTRQRRSTRQRKHTRQRRKN